LVCQFSLIPTTFIIKVKILDIIEKHWSRFKKDNVYTIDNITYFDLIHCQCAKIQIINWVYWDGDEGYVYNTELINNLLEIKSQTDNIDDTRKIKDQINYIHRRLLRKDKIKKIINTTDE
jgi:hypothetical protein